MRRLLPVSLLALLLVPACGGDDSDDEPPPPPPQTAAAPVPAQPAAPPGQVMVTVVANSTPPGATVVGGGRSLGTTPLTAQVPIPAPAPGAAPQTFAFNFGLEGYQPATINASPVNNTIQITAALAPLTAPTPVPGDPAAGGNPAAGGGGREVRVSGRGGGPIWDNHTTTGTAAVGQPCMIDTLRVRLSGEHSFFGDLHITLRDPQGHSYSLARGGRQNPFRTHNVRRAAGRQAQGTWRLAIADRLAEDSGILRSWSMTMTCR